jgi:hypothetical protein
LFPRTGLALLAVLALTLAVTTAEARAPRTCTKPKPKFRDGSIRIQTTIGSLGNQQWFICSSTIRRPKLWNDQGQYIQDTAASFRRFGNRVAYSWIWDDGAGAGWEIGWVDVRTARAELTDVDFDDVADSAGVDAVAVASNGAMAYLEDVEGPAGTSPQRIGYAPLTAKRGLGTPRVIVEKPGEVDPKSLKITRTVVSWTTKSGEPRSVPVPAAR